jgi:hypothetical protein
MLWKKKKSFFFLLPRAYERRTGYKILFTLKFLDRIGNENLEMIVVGRSSSNLFGTYNFLYYAGTGEILDFSWDLFLQ